MSVISISRLKLRAALRAAVRSRRRVLGHATLIEALEARRLLSDIIQIPAVAPGFQSSGPVVAPDGQDTVIPITSHDADNLPLTFSYTSNNPDFSVTSLPPGTFIDMQVTDGVAGGVNGDLVFELFNSLTPNTVNSITGLVDDGFYNGITFSRIVSNFVAQAGSPGGGTSYDAGYTIPDEFNSTLLYDGNGQLGMARTSDNDTNSTQFFITDGNQQGSLDFQYTIFGQLISGFSTFNQIMNLPTGDTPANPTVTITTARVIQDDTDECIMVTPVAGTPSGASGTITVTANDGAGVTSSGTIEVGAVQDTMAAEDDPPYFLPSYEPNAVQFNYSVAENGTLNIPLSAATFDIYGGTDTIAASVTDTVAEGTATVSSGTLTVTPTSGFTGAIHVQLTVTRSGDSDNTSPDTRDIIVTVGSTSGGQPNPTFLSAVSNQTPVDPNTTNTFTVGTFTDTNTSDTASDFTATVEFDTGVTPTTATVSGGSGTFTVNASNIYPSAGTYEAIVSVTDVATSSVILTFDTTVIVQAVALPAYRLYNTILHEHLITLDANENSVLLTEPGWISEGTPFDMYAGPETLNGVQATPLYRLYDIVNGQHLFTADLNEYNTLRLTPGWRNEGIAGYVFLTPVTINNVAAEPLYRLVFGFLPDVHLFTTDTNEVSVLTSQDGWVDEGIACYVVPS